MRKEFYVENYSVKITINPKTGKRFIRVTMSDIKGDFHISLPENYLRTILENSYERENQNIKRAR